MNWNEVYGTQNEKPLELDKESSPTTVYLRKDIERVTRADEETEESHEYWHYYEIAMPRADYAIMVAENAQAAVDYVAMMTDVEIDTEEA